MTDVQLSATTKDLWEVILRRFSANRESSVHIYAACTVEGTAAAKTIEELFRVHNVQWVLHAVASIAQLREVVTLQQKNLDAGIPVSVVMLGIGANLDLPSLFSQFPKFSTVHLLDSHRPIHVANLRVSPLDVVQLESVDRDTSEGVDPTVVTWGWEEAIADVEAFLKDLKKSDKKMKEGTRKRQRRGEQYDSDSDDEEDEEDESSDEEEENDDSEGQNSRLPKFLRRGMSATAEKLYYGTCYWTTDAATLLLAVAEEILKMTEVMVWNAAVVVSDMFSMGCIERNVYAAEMMALEGRAQNVGSGGSRRTVLGDRHTNAFVTNRKEDEVEHAATYRTVLEARTTPHLPMLQHWSLEGALRSAPLTAAAMCLHKGSTKGDPVRKLLADAGCSIDNAMGRWRDVSEKESILEGIGEVMVKQYRVSSFTIRTIIRAVGYAAQYTTALDMACMVRAVLCQPSSERTGGDHPETKAVAPSAASSEHLADVYRNNFHQAQKLIDSTPGSELYSDACNAAIELSRVVTEASNSILQQQLLVPSKKTFHTAVVVHHHGGPNEWFNHPAAVHQLGMLLRDAHMATASEKLRVPRPIVVCRKREDDEGIVGAIVVSLPRSGCLPTRYHSILVDFHDCIADVVSEVGAGGTVPIDADLSPCMGQSVFCRVVGDRDLTNLVEQLQLKQWARQSSSSSAHGFLGNMTKMDSGAVAHDWMRSGSMEMRA